MTVKEIYNWLSTSAHKDGDRLPSVRKVAATLGASTFTVFKAFKQLIDEKQIFGEQGNGYFWGQKNTHLPVIHPKESVEERIERLFVADWKSGKISADDDLPSIKDMAQTYECSYDSMRRMLEKMVAQGILSRKGQGRFFFTHENRKERESKEILLILRCNQQGDFFCLEDRELDFMQKIYSEAKRHNLHVKLLGYYADGDCFLDQGGNQILMEDQRHCFGAVISTMMFFNLNQFFVHFARTKFPISIWWEHQLTRIPRVLKSEKRYAFFNLAFGETPGRTVGHFLKKRGIQRVAFISPYHSSAWSNDRLNGLKKAGLNVTEVTDATHASPFDFTKEREGKMDEILLSIIDRAKGAEAWVAVNDIVGMALYQLKKTGKIKDMPYTISFDNTIDSYRIRMDSYQFNLQTLAEQSVFHLISPGVTLYKKGDFREVSGYIVEK